MFYIFLAIVVVPVLGAKGNYIGAAPQRPGCRAKLCDDRPECPTSSCTCLFASQMDCAAYYQCVGGKPLKYECSPGLLFNGETLTCDYSDNVNCSLNTTTIEPEKSTEMLNTTLSTIEPTTEGTTETSSHNNEQYDATTFAPSSTTAETTTAEPTRIRDITSVISTKSTDVDTTTQLTDKTSTIQTTEKTTTIQTTEETTTTKANTGQSSTTFETAEDTTTATFVPSSTAETTTAEPTTSKYITSIISTKSADVDTTTQPTEEATTIQTTDETTTTKADTGLSSTTFETAEDATTAKTTGEISTTKYPDTETTTGSTNIQTEKSSTEDVSSTVEILTTTISSPPPTTILTTTPKKMTTSTETTNTTVTSTVHYTTESETTQTTTVLPPAGFVCPSRFGLFPDPSSCFRFYQCSHWIPYHKWCPSDLHFNPNLTVCDWPYRAGCALDTTEGLMESTEMLSTTSSAVETTTEVITERTTINNEPYNTTAFVPSSTNAETTTAESTTIKDLTSIITGRTTPEASIISTEVTTMNPTTETAISSTNSPTEGTLVPDETTRYRQSSYKTDTSTITVQSTTDVFPTEEKTTETPGIETTVKSSPTTTTVLTTTPKETTTLRETSTFKTTNTTVPSTTEYKTTQPQKVTTSNPPANFVCPSRFGLFPDPSSCLRFYQCSHWVPYHKRCPSELHFNPTLEVCDWPYRAGCEESDQTTTTMEVLPSHQNDTHGPCDCDSCELPIPGDCTAYLRCTDRVATRRQCGDGLYFNPMTETCDVQENVRCSKNIQCPRTGRFLYHGSCSYFVECRNGNKTVRRCPEGLHFNESSEMCSWTGSCSGQQPDTNRDDQISVDIAICDGCNYCFKPYAPGCSSYVRCFQETATEEHCAPGLFFNPSTQLCDHDYNVDCPGPEPQPECPKNSGLFPYPGECGLYLHCVNGSTTVKRCPGVLHFDTVKKHCEWPWSAGCGNSDPTPTTEFNPVLTDCDCDCCLKPASDDCKSYILCIEKVGFEGTCSSGLLFNSQTENCDFAENVECNITSPDEPRYNCPEHQGLFPHPEDCRKFIHCDHGISHVKDCPSDLHFNPQLKVCDWPYSAGCQSFPTILPPVEDSDMPCDICDSCFIPINGDCASYIFCRNGTGHKLRCTGSLLFNPEIEACDLASNVDCPNPQNLRCPKPDGLFPAQDCSQFIHCSNGIAYLKDCPDGLYFNAETLVCDWPESANCGEVPTIPTKPSKLPDDSDNDFNQTCDCDCCFLPNAKDCSKYFLCLDGYLFEGQCSKGLLFNPSIQNCDLAERVICGEESPLCPEPNGLFPNPDECSSFVRCSSGTPKVELCPNGTHFSAVRDQCLNPCEAKCDSTKDCQTTTSTSVAPPSTKSLICIDSEGFYPSPNDCSSFYMCSSGKAHNVICPEGLHYSTEYEVCEDPCDAKCDLSLDCNSPSRQPTSASTSLPSSTSTPSVSSSTSLPSSTFTPSTSSTSPPNCPGGQDGLFPSEDCSTFYQCSHGKAYLMKCPRGLHFSSGHQVCEDPCVANCSKTIDCSPTTPKTTSSTSSPHCVETEGLYPVVEDCTAFYLCSDGKEHLIHCPPGLHYGVKIETCDYPCVAQCNTSVDCSTSVKPVDPSSTVEPLSPECSEANGLFRNPEDCESFYQCSNGRFHLIRCPSGLHFSLDDSACEKPCVAGCDISITCPTEIPDAEGNCTCEACYLPDPSDCSAFYFCSGGRLTKSYCPLDMLFDKISSSCQNQNTVDCESNGDPSMCPEPFGYFPYPGECKKFLHCDGGVAHVRECAGNLEFDPENKVCTKPKGYCGDTVLDPHCPDSTGLFPDPMNCSLFYHCEHGVAYPKHCSSPLMFNPVHGVCDWPENVDCGKDSPISSSTTPQTKYSTSSSTRSTVTSTPRYNISSTSEPCYVVPGVICPCACRVPTYDDCSSFLQCQEDGTACKKYCPEGLYFNKREMVCDLPINLECRDFFFTTIKRTKYFSQHPIPITS